MLLAEIYQETVKKNMLDNEPASGNDPNQSNQLNTSVDGLFVFKEIGTLPGHSEKVKLEAPSQNPQQKTCRC